MRMFIIRRFIVKVVTGQQRLGVDLQGGVFRCSCRAMAVPRVLLYIEGGFARKELLVLHGGGLGDNGTSLSAHCAFKKDRSHAMVRLVLPVHQQGWGGEGNATVGESYQAKQAFQGFGA